MTAFPTGHSEPLVPLEDDPCPDECGVLLRDRIKWYVDEHQMIDPFSEGSLEPAGYQMRVGRKYCHGCEEKELCEGEFLEIAPHDVVIIETTEHICIPRFMIARWNIKVKLAYKGLLWVGAAQVDPGYVGHLACPIYNLSKKPVRLRRNEKLALIDFVKTTPYDKGSSKPSPSRSRGIRDFAVSELESALSQYRERVDEVQSESREQVDKVQKAVDDVRAQATYFVTLVITLLGVLFAVLMGGMGGENFVTPIPEWGSWVRIGAVALSLALSAAALVLVLRRKSGWSLLQWSLGSVVAVTLFLLGLSFR